MAQGHDNFSRNSMRLPCWLQMRGRIRHHKTFPRQGLAASDGTPQPSQAGNSHNHNHSVHNLSYTTPAPLPDPRPRLRPQHAGPYETHEMATVYSIPATPPRRTHNTDRRGRRHSTQSKPSPHLYRSGSQLSSGDPIIDKVATGSTAEIKAPNRSGSIGLEVSIRASPCSARQVPPLGPSSIKKAMGFPSMAAENKAFLPAGGGEEGGQNHFTEAQNRDPLVRPSLTPKRLRVRNPARPRGLTNSPAT